MTTADQDDHDGISWPAASLAPNGGTHQVHAPRREQAGARPTWTTTLDNPCQNHKVDAQKPQLEYAEVDGSALKLGYSENLKTTAPPNNAFTISVDGEAAVNPTNVAISRQNR